MIKSEEGAQKILVVALSEGRSRFRGKLRRPGSVDMCLRLNLSSNAASPVCRLQVYYEMKAKIKQFEGFSPALFRFFEELAANNNKDWFDIHRAEYESLVLGTIKSFVVELGPFVTALNPELQVEPLVGRTISRIANDMRFQRNRPPYRPHIYMSYPRRGKRWSDDALLYVGIGATGLSIGFYPGGHRPLRTGPIQDAIRDNLRGFQRYLDETRIPRKYWELAEGENHGLKKWPLPKSARRWTDLESFTVGEFFDAGDTRVRRRSFLETARSVFLDLYPLWLFATSSDLSGDLEFYRENRKLLERPVQKKSSSQQAKSQTNSLTKPPRSRDDRRQHHSR